MLAKLGFFVAGAGRQREGRGAVVAARRRGQGRHRRGNRAHPRRRPRAGDAVRARRGGAQAGADHRASANPQGQARGCRRAGWSRPSPGRSSPSRRPTLFGGGKRGAGAGQSDRGRPVRHAAEPDSRTWSRAASATPIAAFPMWRCSRSGRSSKAISRRINSPPPPECGARWPSRAAAAAIGRARPADVDAFDVKADALAVLAAAGAPRAAMQVVPGGPAWFHPGRSGTIQIGPQNVLGHFGELHPRALEALDAEGPLVAFEVILERIPEPQGEGDARQAGAGALAVPAGGARFRVRGRSRREGRRHRARRAERRPQADHRCHRVRRLRRRRASRPARNRSRSRSPCSRARRP